MFHGMLKMAPNFVLGSKKSSTYPGGYASGLFSPAALLGRGAARWGWVGVKVDHFEQPDTNYVREEKVAESL